MKSIVILALLGQVQSIQFRPPTGATPWHQEKFEVNKWLHPDFPHSYVVQNFGEDPEIAMTQQHITEAEKLHHATLNAAYYKAKPIPDLRMQNFGEYDHEIDLSLKHTVLAEKERKHQLTGKFIKPTPIPDLKRPNFGDQDKDIKETQQHIQDAEQKHQATLHAEFFKLKPIPDLRRPNFGDKDIDVIKTQDSLKLAEKKLGKKFGKTKPTGLGGFQAAAQVEGEQNQIQDQSAAQVEAEINVESDPVCSSAGCSQYLHPKAKSEDRGPEYAISPLGPDEVVSDVQRALAIAEKTYKHHWEFGTAKSRALKKYHNAATDTLYNFKPELDEDIKDTQKHLADQEKKLNHVYRS